MLTTRPRILTWHVHGSYLYYLTQANCEFYVPVKKNSPEGYVGLPQGNFPWRKNTHEIAAEQVKDIDFDCILFQSRENYLHDQYDILSEKQLSLPKVYLEHDPPRQTPTNTKHLVSDPDVLLVHVTHYNNLFWDNNDVPTTVIPHGVSIPKHVKYKGKLNKGIVVVNNLFKRGRRLGLDVFETVRNYVPLDIVGIDSATIGGLGEISHVELPSFISQYRFFFNPIRYTSLGLSMCEAMMVGLPIITLSTTEMPEIIENGKEGFLSNDLNTLIPHMQRLLQDKKYAKKLSENAKNTAQNKFNIERFAREWDFVFQTVIQKNKRKNIQTSLYPNIGGTL